MTFSNTEAVFWLPSVGMGYRFWQWKFGSCTWEFAACEKKSTVTYLGLLLKALRQEEEEEWGGRFLERVQICRNV